jgi:hypothetical protein
MASARELNEKSRAEERARAEERIEKSRAEGRRALLVRLLEAKFERLTANQTKMIEALDDDQIDDLSIRLLTATSAEQLGL